jgi:ankyrin repeat protein
VANGWDVHAARDRNGCTALNWAAGEGRLDIVRVLVEEMNVDANALTGKPKRKRHSLHWAARNGHVDVSAYFIFDRMVSPDIPTEDGTTPLHYACMMSHLEMARWLVDDAHCDVNSLNSFGCNASQWCALAGCVPVMRLLRDRGLDLHLLNRNGHSVLHKSAMKGKAAAVEFFIQVSNNTYILPALHGVQCLCLFVFGPWN